MTTRPPVYQIRRSTAWWLAALAVVLTGLGVAGVVSWSRLAARAQRATELEATVARLTAEQSRVAELARELDSIASAYDDIRSYFGTAVTPGSGDLWLPPSTGRPTARALPSGDDEGTRPTEWPLTQPGFLTRSPTAGGTEEHPGIDVAVPAGSYVRAAGSGTVLETGEDDVYGSYLIIDHGNGYRTLYGHASLVVAVPGSPVRRGEVVALSGSSGRSTAPHLHFEIVENGTAVDPLTLVSPP